MKMEIEVDNLSKFERIVEDDTMEINTEIIERNNEHDIKLILEDEHETKQITQENEDLELHLSQGHTERLDLLETGLQTCRDRLDGFGQELKVLLVEINIISTFIKEQFGVELIDKTTQLRKHIQDFDEIEELTKSLSAFENSGTTRRSKRQAAVKWRMEHERRRRLRRRKQRFLKDDGVYNENSEYCDYADDCDELALNSTSAPEDMDNFVKYDPLDVLIHEELVSEMKPNRRNRRRNNEGREFSEERKNENTDGRKLKKKKRLKSGEDNGMANPLIGEVWGNYAGVKRRVKYRKLVEPDEAETQNTKRRGRPRKEREEKSSNVSDKTPMQCAECGKILKGPGSLKSHMNMHADLRPFPCPKEGCGKRFRVKNKLNLHMMLHTGDKKEQCRFCGRLFYFPKDLARHERTHTGEKPHPCSYCGKSFNVKQHLTLHIRTHTGERPYQCPTCQKRFSQANSLRIHKKIHAKAALSTNTSKLSRATSKHKNLNTQTDSKWKISGVKNDSRDVELKGTEECYSVSVGKIMSVVVQAGTSTHPSHIFEIQQEPITDVSDVADVSRVSQGLKNQIQLIPIQSQEGEWKLTNQNPSLNPSFSSIQTPIYTINNRLPVIASRNKFPQNQLEIVGREEELHFQQHTAIRYFSTEEEPK